MIVSINKNDGPIAKIIKEKFNKHNGKAFIPMLKGDDKLYWATEEGLLNDGYTALLCRWEEFDLIVEKIKELGGLMYRGDAAAQKGFALGSDELPLDTMDAFIAINFFGSKIGETITRRSTYYSAVLAWAGIVKNCRSQGYGGYVYLC